MNIVILDGYTENPGDLSWEGLEAFGALCVYDRTPPNDEREIIRRVYGADVVFTNKTPISRTVLDACPTVKFISVMATGYNVVDVAAAREKGIPVSNVPTYGTEAVGQFAIALLLEVCHHIGHHDHAVKNGKWEHCADFCFWDYPLIELCGKSMGVIGFGRIGQTTGRIAKALGMKVLAYDTYASDSGRAIADYVSLDTLFHQSDVIVLHCPLTPATEGLVSKASISKMKDGVILINNSRGPLVIEQDLADALKSGKVYAAGVDVVSTEPIKSDNPLLTAPNCIITPHISWASKECRQRIMAASIGNLKAFINNAPINRVNG